MIQPRNDYLFCTRYERPDRSPGGVWIPDSYREDRTGYLWEVVRTGPGRLTRKGVRIPCECQPGDIVFVEHPYTAMEVADDEEEGWLVPEQQVLSIEWRPGDADS